MRILLFFLILKLTNPIVGQIPTDERIAGEVLICLRAGFSAADFLKKLPKDFPKLVESRAIFPQKNIWQFNFDENQVAPAKLQKMLRQRPEVFVTQWNFKLQQRKNSSHFPHPSSLTPNDPYFPNQYHLNPQNLAAEQAWQITTGGITPAGDTIVVAVIDGGFDLKHPDFEKNIWQNNQEIPTDGLDNDQNGYTDDRTGWNFISQNDSPNGYNNPHGTATAGIIGARGNNGKGIAGINWQVKIMPVVCAGTIAGILQAYSYVLKMRQLYNSTGGQRGAFVVASNASWGINFGQPADAPLWCEVYETLGEAGILNIAATANANIDVDSLGDLPTTCPSEFLVAVTSLDQSGKHFFNSGFGKTHIDLASFGENIYSLQPPNQCAKMTGTSFAAPQIAAAVALLYASPCPNLVETAKVNPAVAALHARDLLLNFVKKQAELLDLTASGGRLDLKSLIEGYENQCAACPPPFGLKLLAATDSSLLIDWSELADFQTVDLKFRVAGSGTAWSKFENINPPFWLEGLTKCTDFEITLKSGCDGSTSLWSEVSVFKTAGCCATPAQPFLESQNLTEVNLQWVGFAAAEGYFFQIRAAGNPDWEIYKVDSQKVTLKNLAACTEFEAQVAAICSGTTTEYSSIFLFKTTGCGTCTDANFCSAAAQNALFAWLEKLKIGNWEHESSSGAGYQNFTIDNQTDTLRLLAGKKYTLELTPGFVGSAQQIYFRVFADLNLDGDFFDANELIFDPGFSHDGILTGAFELPDSLPSGNSRLRVLAKKYSNFDTPPLPCGIFEQGQAVDFCFEQGEKLVSDGFFKIEKSTAPQLFPNPTTGDFFLKIMNEKCSPYEILMLNAMGRLVKTQITGHLPTGEQVLKIESGGLPRGFYFLEIWKNGEVWRMKLIRE